MVVLTPDILLILFCVALFAGFIDAIAGGGGLITLPILLLTGFSPLLALGTNKLQGTVGALTSTLVMVRKKRVSPYKIKDILFFAIIGGLLGTLGVQLTHSQSLDFIVPIVLIVIALYFLFAKPTQWAGRKAKMKQSRYRWVVLFIGFYDGFLGPGTGSFLTMAGGALRGQDLITATAHAKALNFVTNLASLFIFILGGHVVWFAGFIMMLGQVLGSYLGVHVVLSRGAKFIRPLIVTICCAMLMRYLYIKI